MNGLGFLAIVFSPFSIHLLFFILRVIQKFSLQWLPLPFTFFLGHRYIRGPVWCTILNSVDNEPIPLPFPLNTRLYVWGTVKPMTCAWAMHHKLLFFTSFLITSSTLLLPQEVHYLFACDCFGIIKEIFWKTRITTFCDRTKIFNKENFIYRA